MKVGILGERLMQKGARNVGGSCARRTSQHPLPLYSRPLITLTMFPKLHTHSRIHYYFSSSPLGTLEQQQRLLDIRIYHEHVECVRLPYKRMNEFFHPREHFFYTNVP
jgi:hypothetical protein